MVFSGRIDNSNNPLGAGMEVDVLNLDGLLVASPMSVEGLRSCVCCLLSMPAIARLWAGWAPPPALANSRLTASTAA